MTDLARVGSAPAPVLAWHSRHHVLAFVRDWTAEREPLDAIRAHLRGLGAGLVVVAGARIWTIGPDDDLAEVTPLADPAAVARAFGVPRGGDAVFVLDGRGRVRFAHGQAAPVAASLLAALEAAGAALHVPAPRVVFTRREWAMASLVTGFAFAFLGGACKEREHASRGSAPPPPRAADPEVDIVLRVNGTDRKLRVEPRTSLLDALRERLGLPGTKKGCDAGQCGACTVLADGKRVVACLTLAVMAQGQKLTTIEGLADGDALHPVQRAFVEHDALQCGYCTPGQILSAVALLAEGRAKTDAEVREQMSGNLCRCGAYPNIVAAIQAARTARG